MGTIGSLGMGGMSGMGEMEQAAGALEQAAGALEQVAGNLLGGSQGPSQLGGSQNPSQLGGSQNPSQSAGSGGPQGLEQELSQALQQLSQELQQLTGNQQGGSQVPGGGPGPVQAGGGAPQGGGAPVQGGGSTPGGSGQPSGISGNEASELPDLMNLEVDSAGNAPSSRPSHVGGDMDRLRNEVQQGMKDGNISMQTGSKALEDIGSGNVQAVEKDLSGTSGSTAGLDAMQANTPAIFNPNAGAY